jgi:hypothetical protein
LEGRINEDEDIVAPAAVVSEEKPAADVPVEEEEPPVVDNTLTYAEYMASKGKKEETSLREMKNEFAGVTVAVKEVEDTFISMGGIKKKKKQKQKEAKKTIALGFRVVGS